MKDKIKNGRDAIHCVSEVNLREAIEIIKHLYLKEISVILIGSPGIGKTQGFVQATKQLKIGCRVEEASSLDPTDTRGVPYVLPEKNKSFWGIPQIMPDCEEDGKDGILVIDEVASCLPATQVALYPLFLNRRLGSYKLPEGWIAGGTGNHASDGAFAYQISSALKDRVVFLNVKPNFEQWKEDFAIVNGIHHTIIGFLNFRPDLFYTFENGNKQRKDKGFATLRSYEIASKIIETGMQGKLLQGALSGCLGEGVAIEYIGFIKYYDELPNIEKIFKNKTNEVPGEPSVLFALGSALIAFLKDLEKHHRKDMKFSDGIDRLLDYSMKMPADFAILTIKDAVVIFREQIQKSKNWLVWAEKYGNVILGN